MINIRFASIPANPPLTRRETEAAIAIFDFINRCFGSIGLELGAAELQVIKRPQLGAPRFCPQSLNPESSCDCIYLSMESFNFWCQLIFQASHEFTHCVIHYLNSQENQKSKWIEETICEAMSLVFLNTFASSWDRVALSKANISYDASVQDYLSNELKERGNHRLGNCHGIEELREINRTSEAQREDRREEMHQLYSLIRSAKDIQSLVHYRDFVISGTILLDTKRYQDEYPSSRPIQYLCSLQDSALRREAVGASVSV